MPIHLSNRQRKAADRAGGIELMIAWPAELPVPAMDDDTEIDAGPDVLAWVREHVEPAVRDAGLVTGRVQIVRTVGPSTQGPAQRTCVAVVIIGRRWIGARGRPYVMWHDPTTARDSR
jgi:hypothetical protein